MNALDVLSKVAHDVSDEARDKDGKWTAGAGGVISNIINSGKPHHSEGSAVSLSLPLGYTMRGKWHRDNQGPMQFSIKVSRPKGQYGGYVGILSATYKRSTRTMEVRPWTFTANTEHLGAMLGKLVAEVREKIPECEKFELELTRASVNGGPVRVSNPGDQETFDALFTDGKPNDMFPSGQTLARKATPSDIADDETLKVIPIEMRAQVTKAVRRELASCALMPKKLALLTDSPVVGVHGNANSMAWAMRTADGGAIVRVMSSKAKWARELAAPVTEQPICNTVAAATSPDRRVDVILTHEMGHVLDYAIKHAMEAEKQRLLASGAVGGGLTPTPLTDSYQMLKDAWRKPSTGEEYKTGYVRPSRYAVKGGFTECFAECYAAWRHGLKCPPAFVEFFRSLEIEGSIVKVLAQLYQVDARSATGRVFDCGLFGATTRLTKAECAVSGLELVAQDLEGAPRRKKRKLPNCETSQPRGSRCTTLAKLFGFGGPKVPAPNPTGSKPPSKPDSKGPGFYASYFEGAKPATGKIPSMHAHLRALSASDDIIGRAGKTLGDQDKPKTLGSKLRRGKLTTGDMEQHVQRIHDAAHHVGRLAALQLKRLPTPSQSDEIDSKWTSAAPKGVGPFSHIADAARLMRGEAVNVHRIANGKNYEDLPDADRVGMANHWAKIRSYATAVQDRAIEQGAQSKGRTREGIGAFAPVEPPMPKAPKAIRARAAAALAKSAAPGDTLDWDTAGPKCKCGFCRTGRRIAGHYLAAHREAREPGLRPSHTARAIDVLGKAVSCAPALEIAPKLAHNQRAEYVLSKNRRDRRGVDHDSRGRFTPKGVDRGGAKRRERPVVLERAASEEQARAEAGGRFVSAPKAFADVVERMAAPGRFVHSVAPNGNELWFQSVTPPNPERMAECARVLRNELRAVGCSKIGWLGFYAGGIQVGPNPIFASGATFHEDPHGLSLDVGLLRPLEAGRVRGNPELAITYAVDDPLRGTIMHEFGHVWMDDLRARGIAADISTEMDGRLRAGHGKLPSAYAGADRDEFFAECYVAWRLRKFALLPPGMRERLDELKKLSKASAKGGIAKMVPVEVARLCYGPQGTVVVMRDERGPFTVTNAERGDPAQNPTHMGKAGDVLSKEPE